MISEWKRQGGIIVAGPGKHNISYIHKHLNLRYRLFLRKLHPRPVTYAMQNVGFTQDKEAGDDPEIQEILKACCVQDN
ncbi:hypothetical protein SASPL_155226 [Salvia splendens]|uniref:Uncharacterized protein n=1 Tax=Salvia splendens TaxID=180675 RepID=A0A8X8W1G7_SALSN|nr:hypothetical protein SASPL_155226 [Salvia splendens]